MQLGGGVQITAGNSTAAAAAAPVAANATAAAAAPPLFYQGPSVGPQQIPAVAIAVPNATTAATAPVSAAARAANNTTGVLKEPLHARIIGILSPVCAEALIRARSTFQPVGLPYAWIKIAESMLSRIDHVCRGSSAGSRNTCSTGACGCAGHSASSHRCHISSHHRPRNGSG